MATTLVSPGVAVNVIDESFYTPAQPGTVPMIFVATAQDKANASKTGTAQGTTSANAGKVWLITSQRDLVDTFGVPLFYTDSGGNSIHGSELNEYGLQAAYSMLGASSRAYIVRADVDLAQLEPNTSIPAGDPVAGTYWVDTNASLYGVYEWDNRGKGSFVRKTPLVINNDNTGTNLDINSVPVEGFGQQGDYAMVVTSDNSNSLYYKTSSNAWVLVSNGFDSGKQARVSPHYTYPDYTTSTLSGSVWVKTTSPGYGANWVVKYYNGSTKTWNTVSAPIYDSTRQALEKLDYSGGGINLPVGTLFIESNYEHNDNEAIFKIWRRYNSGATQVIVQATTATSEVSSSFKIRETLSSSSAWGSTTTVTIAGSTETSIVSLIPAALSAAGLVNVTGSYDSTTGKFTFKHKLGGDFMLEDDVNTPLATALVLNTTVANVYAAPAGDTDWTFLVSNWKPLVYEAKDSAPYTTPADGTLWYDNNLSDVDILYHNGTTWVGYRDASAFPGADPNGPIVSALEPTTQSDGVTALADGDIWVSTASVDRYGKDVYIWDDSAKEWVLQDVADQSSPNGWLFANARWSTAGETLTKATIAELLTSNYLDPDAPDPALYPKGVRLWNLRRSGFNVKKYIRNYIDITANEGLNIRYENDSMDNYEADRWVCVSPNNEDGSGSFGRFAQRSFVVAALNELIQTNGTARDTDTLTFNLIACPGYPETIQNMIALNVDRAQTAFVVGDTPFRLKPNATDLSNWGNNTAGALNNGEDGAVSYDEYMAMFYPSGYTTDNSGNNIVVPPSHMMLRTIINSDAKSYQWFAPAGTRRGVIDNANSVGYIDAETGEFKTVSVREELRDVLYNVNINPIATLPGVGLVNMGQKTRARNASALDRINVARLVCYLRRQLAILAKPFLFEPNDPQTRREIKAAAESLMLELVGQRALYDFIVVCDSSNNTPARIDRNELYMDIAVEPVKSVEFIYIPLRIKNTGEIAAGQ